MNTKAYSSWVTREIPDADFFLWMEYSRITKLKRWLKSAARRKRFNMVCRQLQECSLQRSSSSKPAQSDRADPVESERATKTRTCFLLRLLSTEAAPATCPSSTTGIVQCPCRRRLLPTAAGNERNDSAGSSPQTNNLRRLAPTHALTANEVNKRTDGRTDGRTDM